MNINVTPIKRGPGRPRAEMTVKALDAIRQLLAAGETVTEDKIAARAGCAAGTANKAWSQFRATQEAAEKATAEAQEKARDDQLLEKAEASFSAKSKLKVEDAIRIHRKRLDKAFMATVHEEVHRQLAASNDAVRRGYEELKKSYAGMERTLAYLRASKGSLTADEHRVLLRVCHPDNSAGPELRNQAFQILTSRREMMLREV